MINSWINEKKNKKIEGRSLTERWQKPRRTTPLEKPPASPHLLHQKKHLLEHESATRREPTSQSTTLAGPKRKRWYLSATPSSGKKWQGRDMTPPRLVVDGVERRMAEKQLRKKRGAWSSSSWRRRRREEGLGGNGEGRDDGSHGSWNHLDCLWWWSFNQTHKDFILFFFFSFGVYLMDPLHLR